MQGNVQNNRGNNKNIVSEECRQVIEQCSFYLCSIMSFMSSSTTFRSLLNSNKLQHQQKRHFKQLFSN